MALAVQEAVAVLSNAIHLCNRACGSGATRALLAGLLDGVVELQSLPPAEMPAPAPLLTLSGDGGEGRAGQERTEGTAPCQPVYRGRWADLASDDSEG